MKRGVIAAVLSLMLVGAWPHSAAADGLSIGPLEYKTSLKAGEAKKGFVQVQNQSSQPVEVHLRVQAFKQINDQGGLEFYDSEAVSAGVKLDLDDIEIAPYAAAHVYFLLEGAKLPSGDVFAAIFATTASKEQVVTVPSVQVGTLLLITNGTPPSHHAVIGSMQASWFQTGNGVLARFAVRNIDPPQKLTGFTPSLSVSTWPYSHKTITGPLVFAGRSREVAYTQPGNYFGPLFLKVKTGSSEQSRVVFAVTGFWQWLAPLLLVILVLVITGIYWLVRKKSRVSQI